MVLLRAQVRDPTRKSWFLQSNSVFVCSKREEDEGRRGRGSGVSRCRWSMLSRKLLAKTKQRVPQGKAGHSQATVMLAICYYYHRFRLSWLLLLLCSSPGARRGGGRHKAAADRKSQKTLWEPFRYYCWIILVHPEVGHGVDCWSFFSRGRNYGNLSHGWYRLEHVCDV